MSRHTVWGAYKPFYLSRKYFFCVQTTYSLSRQSGATPKNSFLANIWKFKNFFLNFTPVFPFRDVQTACLAVQTGRLVTKNNNLDSLSSRLAGLSGVKHLVRCTNPSKKISNVVCSENSEGKFRSSLFKFCQTTTSASIPTIHIQHAWHFTVFLQSFNNINFWTYMAPLYGQGQTAKLVN